MPWQALAFSFGVWGVQQLAVLLAPIYLGITGTLGTLLWLAWRRHALPAVAGALLLGIAWAGGFAYWRLADALPPDWEGRDVEVTGVVADLPQHFERGLRFTLAVEQANGPVPQRIALAWYRQTEALVEEEGDHEEAAAGTLPLPRSGERWRFLVRLKRPHGSVNPHGFDYEAWLFERNLRATGYVRKSALTGRLDREAGGLQGMIGRLREATRERIRYALPDQPFAGIVAALAIGDQQAISPDQWRLFAATGVTHLFSVSGAHVTLLGALVAWLANRFWRRSPRLPLVWPAQKAAAVAGFLGAFFYALLSGFGVPAQRTLYMLGVALVALLSGRAPGVSRVLGAALVLVLLLDPWAVLAAGFWLSFGAVALLFHVGTGQHGARHWLHEWLRAQWSIALGLLPLLLVLFQQFSLVSPLANAVAIPLIGMVVTPLALFGTLPGLAWLLDLAHGLLVPLMAFLEALAGWPGALWQQHAPPAWAVPLALFGAVWLLLPRGMPGRWLGIILFLPLFVFAPARPQPGEVVATVLDVGQGQAVHVQTATHDLLFDTGPAFGGSADAGSRVLVPYLRAAGVSRLDTLVVSHADRDHAGGADSVLAALPVARDQRRCVAGQQWEWDGVRFQVMHPVEVDYARRLPTNALSCVMRIESPHGSVLIPGDLEGRAEVEFLARQGAAVRADILVAPHHGGRRTASADFVAAVSPREVVFPVGYRNRFGHPHPEVAARFAGAGARLHRTDTDGAVTFWLSALGMTVTHERERRRRYWHNSVPSRITLP